MLVVFGRLKRLPVSDNSDLNDPRHVLIDLVLVDFLLWKWAVYWFNYRYLFISPSHYGRLAAYRAMISI